MEDAALVVSELVTNSHKFAGLREGSPIDLVLDLTQDRLRIEVIDHSIFDPTPETPRELQAAKWGLFLVDRLAGDWGRMSEGGIWVEFRVP